MSNGTVGVPATRVKRKLRDEAEGYHQFQIINIINTLRIQIILKLSLASYLQHKACCL